MATFSQVNEAILNKQLAANLDLTANIVKTVNFDIAGSAPVCAIVLFTLPNHQNAVTFIIHGSCNGIPITEQVIAAQDAQNFSTVNMYSKIDTITASATITVTSIITPIVCFSYILNTDRLNYYKARIGATASGVCRITFNTYLGKEPLKSIWIDVDNTWKIKNCIMTTSFDNVTAASKEIQCASQVFAIYTVANANVVNLYSAILQI